MDSVQFAYGKRAAEVYSVLRGRRRSDLADVATVMRAAMPDPLMTPFVQAWLDGARAVPVVLTDAMGDRLAGLLLVKQPLVVRKEPVDEPIFAAIRSIEEVALRGICGDVLIECSAAPREMVRFRVRGR